jgi:hypothetical protein
MRRLIVEFSKSQFEKIHELFMRTGEFAKIQEPNPLNHIKTFEIIQFLRLDNEEFAAICRIETDQGTPEFADWFEKQGNTDDNFSEGAQILEREKSGAYIVFIRHNLIPPGLNINQLIEGGYLAAIEIREDKIKITYLGTAKEIKTILEKIRQHGVRYKILSLTDAKFSINSPLNGLTEKQRNVLTTAYKLGYYSLPRKISTEQLAKKLNVHKSALAAHRRKAELRLITEVLKEQV